MEFVVASALALLIKKVIDTLKMAAAGDIRGVVTQLATWIAGFVAIYVVAQTPWAAGFDVGNQHLSDLNVWSLLLVGLSIGSAASTTHDVVVALDRNGVPVDVEPGPDRRSYNRAVSRQDR